MRSWHRALGVLLLVVFVLGVVPPSPGLADTRAAACPAGQVPATAFADTVRSTHRAAIDCAAWWGIVAGRDATTFAPGSSVTRGQVAAMVARLLRRTGVAPPAAPAAGFADTVGHRFEADIDLLVALDVLRGFSATEFGPDRPITRAQLASVLARTFANAYAAPLPPGSVPFVDVAPDDVHRGAIGQLVAAGIAAGVTPTTFEPGRSVNRAQTATFTMRSVARLVGLGTATRPTTRPSAGDAYARRERAAWVHLFDGSLKSRSRIQALVDELAAADVTMIVAQVVRRHDAYYVSSVLPRTPDPGVARDFDVLATLLEVAHARGLEVHAWFSVAPTWHSAYANLTPPPGWVHTEHGPTAPVAQRWVTRTVDGTWSEYLDPGLRAVQDHVVAVVRELAVRYPVDGIHLDYVRYESNRHGYHPDALARFRSETGATGTPAPDDATWSAWRRTQTRTVVQRARAAIAASGREVDLSAAVISWGSGPRTPDRDGFRTTLAYTTTLQDWDQWARAGDVDLVLPMNYFRAQDPDQAVWFRRWTDYERSLAATVDTRVVPGVAGYLNQPADVLAQIERAMRADGAAVYSVQQPTLDGSRTVWSHLADQRWRYPPR
jgi:uncharacterized lipoprotein YddW (UPF0748 family)